MPEEVDMQPTICRPEVVERLVRAAWTGMETVIDGTTSAEVLSATFTMTLRNMAFIRETSPPEARVRNLNHMRSICYRLLAETADETVKM